MAADFRRSATSSGRDAGLPGRIWTVELLAPRKAPIPYGLAVEAAVAVGGSFAIAVLTGHTVDGLLAGLGALPVAAADRGGPYRVRLRRILGSGVAIAVGIMVGAVVRGHPGEVVGAGALAALVAGTVSSFDAAWSLAALNLLTYVAIAGIDPLPGPAWRTALIAFSGAAFKAALSVPGHLRQRTGAERRAVAAVFDAAASLLEGASAPDRVERRRALTTALNTAEDSVAALRASLGGPDPGKAQLMLTVEHSLPLARASIDRLATGRPAAPGSVTAVRSLAAAVRSGDVPPGSPPPDADLVDPWAAARRAITGEVGLDGRRWRPSWRSVWEARLSRAAGRRPLEATVRLVLCFTLAEVLATSVVGTRPYWVPLTVAVAMKPDFGSVFARAAQRALGTSVGVVVGGAILVLISDTRQLLPFFVVLAALLPVTVARNYGMFVTCLTPLVLIQLDSISPQPGQLVVARLLNTLIGVGIVLVLGYGIWPSTWRPRLGVDLAAGVAAVAACVRDAAHGDDGAPARRRAAYRALSDLRTTWAQYFADPSPTGRQARLLWPAVVALERMTDEVAHLTGSEVADPSLATDLHRLADALDGLASSPLDPLTAGAAGAGGTGVTGAGGAGSTCPDRCDPGDDGPVAALWDRVGEVAATVDRVRREPMRPAHRLAGVLHLG